MRKEIKAAKEHFGKLLEEQLERVERMKNAEDWTDYAKLKPIIIGIIAGTFIRICFVNSF